MRKRKIGNKIKKKINEFLLGEDGNISKEKVLKVGGILMTAGMILGSDVVHAGHSNVNRFYASGDCVEHSSHNSHGSHSSHGQW